MNNKEIGGIGEDMAARYLVKSGMTLLARNFRVSRMGEIDIIARDNQTICFVEVKARSSSHFGLPVEAVSPGKCRTITRLASLYLSQMQLNNSPVRFDVVEVIMDKQYQVTDIRHLKAAF
jgi:putative endonuclease